MKRITYSEKLELGTKIAEQISAGKDSESIKQELGEQGLNKFDIEKILKTAESLVMDKVAESMRTYMIDGTLDRKRSEFSMLDDVSFEKMKGIQKEQIIRTCNARVSRLAGKGKRQHEICEEVANPFYDQWAVSRQIDEYKKHNVPVSGAEKEKYLILGGGSLLVGLGLTIWSYMNSSSGIIMYYGLVIFGIVNLIRAYSTRGDIEYGKKQRSNRYGNWFK